MTKFAMHATFVLGRRSRRLVSIHISARDEDEAVCAAEAVADFVTAAFAKTITIRLQNLATMDDVKMIERPVRVFKPRR